jgi:hypothetical protein
MNSKAKPLVDEQSRMMIARGYALGLSGKDKEFLESVHRYFRRWGWITERQKFCLSGILHRYSVVEPQQKTSRGHIVCIICKRQRIHPNDSQYAIGVCFECASNATEESGLMPARTRSAPATRGPSAPGAAARRSNSVVVPIRSSSNPPSPASPVPAIGERAPTVVRRTTNGAGAMSIAPSRVLKPLKNLSIEETNAEIERMSREARR